MNEEIKKILENYVNHNEIELILNELREIVDEEIVDYGAELSLSECKCLLNYITNLQEENELLREKLIQIEDVMLYKYRQTQSYDDCETYNALFR